MKLQFYNTNLKTYPLKRQVCELKNILLLIILSRCAMLRCYIVLTHIESQRGKLRHFYVCCLPSQLKISLLDFLGFL